MTKNFIEVTKVIAKYRSPKILIGNYQEVHSLEVKGPLSYNQQLLKFIEPDLDKDSAGWRCDKSMATKHSQLSDLYEFMECCCLL